MSAADYKVEADQNLALALEYPLGYKHLSTADLIALAQVNATLALAEQQRIANLIEVGRDRDRQLDRELNDPKYHVLDGSTLTVSAPTDLLNAANAVKAQIREGLGLS